MSSALYDRSANGSKPYARLIATTVHELRTNLGVSLAELAMASGIPAPSLAAIELGGPTTRAERQEIAVAVAWLANNRMGKV